MTNVKLRVAWLVPWVLAGATVLATNVQAQAGTNAAQGAEDMRLWSFGDCDRRFPYVNTDEHQQCVRVVGSEEAKDARALRVCAVSHALDPVESERCKSAYLANKQKAAQDGVVAGTPASPQAPPSPEVMRSVKAIVSVAVEKDRAASANAAPPAAPEEEPAIQPPEESSMVSTVGVIFLVLLLLGLAATIKRRRQAVSA
jgi:hypothetical protein